MESIYIHQTSSYVAILPDPTIVRTIVGSGRMASIHQQRPKAVKQGHVGSECLNQKLQTGFLFTVDKPSLCLCSWHAKAAARKMVRLSASSMPAVVASSTLTPMIMAASSVPSTSGHSCMSPSSSSAPLLVSVEPSTLQPLTYSSIATTSAAQPAPSTLASGPAPPKFDRSDLHSPTVSKLGAIGIVTRTIPGS